MPGITQSNSNTKRNEPDAGTQLNAFEEQPISRDTFVWLLARVCQLHRQPFNEVLLTQQFVPPYSTTTVLLALRELGYETTFHAPAQASDFTRHLPGIVLLKNALQSPASQPASQISIAHSTRTLCRLNWACYYVQMVNACSGQSPQIKALIPV